MFCFLSSFLGRAFELTAGKTMARTKHNNFDPVGMFAIGFSKLETLQEIFQNLFASNDSTHVEATNVIIDHKYNNALKCDKN